MATGGALRGSSTLSSMRQLALHPPLTCRNVSTLEPHSCEARSLIRFVFLPSRLNPVCGNSKKMRLSPTMCGHGDLEIVSVKELADGFLHFSFGTPSNASSPSKVDGRLSLSSSEHLAEKVRAPRRLPSKFSKKSPIPVEAVRRSKRQGGDASKRGGSPDAGAESVKAAVKSSSRPKSYFVKRSPIPSRGNMPSLPRQTAVLEASVHPGSSQMVTQRAKDGSMKVGRSKRPPSAFIRKSPVPSRSARNHHVRCLDSSSDKAGVDSIVRSAVKSTAATPARPESVFSRRSPIVRAARSPSSPASNPVDTREALRPILGNPSSTDDASRQTAAAMTTYETVSGNALDLNKCKLAELKSLAKTKGLKGYSKLKKGELLGLLQSLDSRS